MAQAHSTDSNRSHRIAILDCASIPVALVQKYGSYSGMFTWRLQDAMRRSKYDHNIEFSEWDVVEGQYPNPNSVDGIIITGGPDSAYDTHAWIVKLGNYIVDVYRHHPNVKLFGTCLGHQLIAHVLLRESGTIVKRSPRGFQYGVRTVELDPKFCSYFPTIYQELRALRIQVIHGDQVYCTPGGLPSDWMSIGRTPCCDVHGLFQPDRVLTLQGHFEMDSISSSEIVRFVFEKRGEYSHEELEAALKDIDGKDDADIAADMILSFLTGNEIGEDRKTLGTVSNCIA